MTGRPPGVGAPHITESQAVVSRVLQKKEKAMAQSTETELDLTSSAFKANPYPTFALLRANDPIHRLSTSNGQSSWLITRYTDADIVLRDERFIKNRQYGQAAEQQNHPSAAAASVDDLFALGLPRFDPPDHTRLRSLVSLSFTPRLVEQWRGRVQNITDDLIDAVASKQQMELIEEFAYPLPIRIISEMLGIPDEDNLRLYMWTRKITDALDDPVAYEQAQDQLLAFYHYLLALIESKRQHPTDDLVSRLIEAEAEGDRLTERELVAMIFLLILAGHETTANLIGNGMLALLTHPEQLALLKHNPDLMKPAVEEFLRYYSPLTLATFRWAREDVEYGGKLMRRGDQIIVSLSAANRDEESFLQPELLDITRQENRHLAFSKGIHYCLGASLARLEGQIAIGTLLRRLPDLGLQVEPEELVWRPGSTVLGVARLPVRFSVSLAR